MSNNFEPKKIERYLTIFLTALAFLVWLAVFSLPDRKLHLVFCDVGQGDAILISRGFSQVLIDGGPDEKVLGCLSSNLAFFDKRIEMVVLTHPDADHLNGLISVLEKYRIGYLITAAEESESAVFAKLKNQVETLEIKVINPYQGDKLKLGEIALENIWPSKPWLAENVFNPLPKGNVLGAKTDYQNTNALSLVFMLRYREKKVLLTGDADSLVLGKMLESKRLGSIDILKASHHGSKTGLTEEFLKQIKPKEAVISVGKNNFGHPAKEVLDLLGQYQVKVRRTDVEGEIEYEL